MTTGPLLIRPASRARRPLVEVVSLIVPGELVMLDPFRKNPLAADAAAVAEVDYRRAREANGPPPKLFTGGEADLPPFTASDLAPFHLERLPYTMRHAIAAMAGTSAAFDLIWGWQRAGCDPLTRLDCVGLTEAVDRMHAWLHPTTTKEKKP